MYIDLENGTDGIFVAARLDSGGCFTATGKGIFFYVYPKNQTYEMWGNAGLYLSVNKLVNNHVLVNLNTFF